MKIIKKIVALVLCVSAFTALVGCGNKEDGPQRGKVTLAFWAIVNENNAESMREVVDNFNKKSQFTQVRLIPKTVGYSQSLSGTLKGSNPPNIVQIEDKYFKGYVNEGYLTNLDEYFKDKVENGKVVRKASTLDLNDIWDTAVNRFRFNTETGYSGGDNSLYALPAGIGPSVLYYNESALKDNKVNLISVDEDKIASYNSKNGTNFAPKGYAVYQTAPAPDMVSRNGKYHVFNNRIPMSFVELVEISKLFTRKYTPDSPTTYGFFNEWWFNFGWSVGGDCLEWNNDKDCYEFVLGDDKPNYLVTGSEGVTINGHKYNASEILSHEDKHFVADVLASESGNNYSEINSLITSEKLYALPSMREAFTLFLQCSQKQDKNVTATEKGLEISPTPTIIGNKSKPNLLTSNEVMFVSDNYTEAYSIGKSMHNLKKGWNIAPLYQYREYDGDELKVVNGTKIQGKKTTFSNTISYAIPENAKSKDRAWEFMEYMAGPEAQKILMKANFYVPNQKSLVQSDEYLNMTDNYMMNNKAVLLRLTNDSRVGDWSYLENGEWVNIWAKVLNTKVRDGLMTLEDFFDPSATWIVDTNEKLKTYKAKKTIE